MNVPTLVLLRDPIDTVLSKATQYGESMIGSLLHRWVTFFEPIASRYADIVVVAKFETSITSPNKLVATVNARFGTPFQSALDLKGAVSDLSIAHTGWNMNPVLPTTKRDELKPLFRPHVHSHPLAAQAKEIYHHLRPDAL